MSNILDYIAWRGDLSLAASPFNAVDNLILSELIYADLKGIVPAQGATLADAWAAYRREGRDQSHMVNDPKPLLEAAAGSRRFGGARLDCYADELDPARELQFAAARFLLEDGTAYIAYRGTDDTLTGWREDFNLSFLAETPAQALAVAALNRAAALDDRPLRVGGHSKGGNLALYAAAFCDDAARRRLIEVYSNDGPGFNRAVAEDERLSAILDRAVQIIPEASLVGVLLDNRARRMVVRSSGSGVMQHDPYTWEVLGTAFVEAPRAGISLYMDETLSQWLAALDDAQRANLTSAVFDTLGASGATTLRELSANRLDAAGSILKAAGAMDPELQKDVLSTLRKLADAGREVLMADLRRAFQQGLEEAREKRRADRQRGAADPKRETV